jgi:predicted nucleotide-binding protein
MSGVTSGTVEERLAAYIEQGEVLLDRARMVGDISDYKSWRTDRSQWAELTVQGIAQIYGAGAEAASFRGAVSARTGDSWQAEYASDMDCVRAALDILISLRGPPELEQQPTPAAEVEVEVEVDVARERDDDVQLAPRDQAAFAPAPPREAELPQEMSARAASAPERSDSVEVASGPSNGSTAPAPGMAPDQAGAQQLGKRVFLVHGMNESWKQQVTRLLEATGSHEVTVLHERPSEGRSLIEQAAGSGYAIVLLTSDEVGAPRHGGGREPSHGLEPFYSTRARQSVVFEMGLLVGVLTPRYVCVLYERGVDLPSEVYGLAYVLLDMAGAWQSKLLMQLRSSGFEYDLDKLSL